MVRELLEEFLKDKYNSLVNMHKNYTREIKTIIADLKLMRNPSNLKGMARFGIDSSKALGIKIPLLRKYAKRFTKDNTLAQYIWETDIHEARILAAYVGDAKTMSPLQMDAWVSDFYSWDICDQCCGNLFDKTPYAFRKAIEWADRDEEFIKRAGFVMMASLAVHDKEASNKVFELFFKYIKKEASDERNFVKKAVNWALRQIGKRNKGLLKQAIEVAEQIREQDSRSAKWIAADALRELRRKSEKHA